MPAFKYPRTSQPQGAVEIDWSNPLTKDLAYLFASGAHRTDAAKKLQPLQGGSIAAAATGRGVALSVSSAPYIPNGPSIVLPVAHTVFCWVKPSTTANQTLVQAGQNSLEYAAYSLKIGSCDGGGSASKFNYTLRWDSTVPEGRTATQTSTLDVDEWYFVVGSHDGTNLRLYINGELESTSVGGTDTPDQIFAARLYVGGDNTADLSGSRYVVSGPLQNVGAFKRCLSEREIKSLSDNPWQLFKAQSRTLWIPGTVSGGGAATVIPIGQQATGSVGTLVATGAAKALPAGVSASSAVGTPVAKGAAEGLPVGVYAVSAIGTPVATGGTVIPATVLPASVSAVSAVGSPAATGAAKASPTGVSAASSVGTPAARGAALGTPLGVSATASVGTPAAITGANIPATALPAGVAANAAVGTVTATGAAREYPLGVQATSAVGTPVVVAGGSAIAMPLGVQATGSIGALIATGQAWRVAGGVSASGAVGTPVVLSGSSAIATPAGLQAVGSTGTPVATGACRTYPLGLAGYWSVGTSIAVPGVSGVAVAYPSGVQVSGHVGAPAAKGAAVALAQGVYATGQVGFPVAGLISIVPPGLVKFVPDAASYAFIPGTDAYSFEVNT